MLTLVIFMLFTMTYVISTEISVVMTMICRDESVNLNENLPLWAEFIDYFIFMIDNRSKDNSKIVINQLLSNKKYFIQDYNFNGFGTARTLSLEKAWEIFPNASHVLIADPDWKPVLDSINKKELDLVHDVFRFTVFDRNGKTKRKMDWLLRNKFGLKMRYNLHEVLDIGHYSTKSISWTVHEIEQPGTWHTTVGHGNSMSSRRYEFDLSLLEKDLQIFGHDPHVHYYLGVTYQGYSEALKNEKNIFNQTSIELSIFYLKLRLYSTYNAEFIEERWACLYSLGSIYYLFMNDFTSTVKWFSLCRDYNPVQSECSIALGTFYLNNGLFDQAEKEIYFILGQELGERIMLNMIRTNECNLPELVINYFALKAEHYQINIDEIKFALLMLLKLKNPMCQKNYDEIKFKYWVLFSPFLNNARDLSLNYNFNEEILCEQIDLQTFLYKKNVKFNICPNFKTRLNYELTCSIFSTTIPSINEEIQITTFKEFIGTLIIPDIIHFAYAGNFQMVFGKTSDTPYTILFLEYFNPKMVYNIIGYFSSKKFFFYKITVATFSRNLISIMEATIDTCMKSSNIEVYPNITFVHLQSISSYLSELTQASSKFDFIEFNGGLSKDIDSDRYFDLFNYILSDIGIIGLTYFTKNKHVNTIKRISKSIIRNYSIPFSLEDKRMINYYFETMNLEFYKNDKELMVFLGSEPIEREIPPQLAEDIFPSPKWKYFYKSEVIQLLEKYHLTPFICFPTLYCEIYIRSFGYDIEKFKIVGMTEDSFLEEFISHFRFSMYITNKENKLSRVSETQLSLSHFENSRSTKIFVIDKLTSISKSLEPLISQIDSKRTSSIGFTSSYIKNLQMSLDFTPSPFLVPSFRILSMKNITLFNLIEENRLFFGMDSNENFESFTQMKIQLKDFLNYLISINAIVMYTQDGSKINSSNKKIVNISEINLSLNQAFENHSLIEYGFDSEFLIDLSERNEFNSTSDCQSNLESVLEINEYNSNINKKLQNIMKLLETTKSQLSSSRLEENNSLSLDISNEYLLLKDHYEHSTQIHVFNNSRHHFRDLKCLNYFSIGKERNCIIPKPLKRKTSGFNISSFLKIQFDINQLLYIKSLYENSENNNFSNIYVFIDNFEIINKYFNLKDFKMNYKVIRSPKSPELSKAFAYCNYQIHHYQITAENHMIFNWGAINKLKNVNFDILNQVDYIVIDSLVQSKSLELITNYLLLSTIWHDISHGGVFFSHIDDGLESDYLVSFSQQIALAISNFSKSFKVVKYFAVAINNSLALQSPVYVGNSKEVTSVFWVSVPHSLDNDSLSNLTIFDKFTADCLFLQGISIYPSVHPDFLSKSGELFINVSTKCPLNQFENVQSLNNRVLFTKSSNPVMFSTQNLAKVSDLIQNEFESNTLLALVFIFEEIS